MNGKIALVGTYHTTMFGVQDALRRKKYPKRWLILAIVPTVDFDPYYLLCPRSTFKNYATD
jgi:hypothetical protein